MKLLLFDVDGTLLTTKAGRAALDATIAEFFEVQEATHNVEMQGCTDLGILKKALSPHGISLPKDLPAFWKRNAEHLSRIVAGNSCVSMPKHASSSDENSICSGRTGVNSTENSISNSKTDTSELPLLLLPGVKKLLREIEAHDELYLGLLTGNAKPIAKVKLEVLNLWHYFPIGSFGSDHCERWRLVNMARERAAIHWRQTFSLTETAIIGDTLRDITAARQGKIKVVAVATGSTSMEQLASGKPDLLLRSFEEYGVLERMVGL